MKLWIFLTVFTLALQDTWTDYSLKGCGHTALVRAEGKCPHVGPPATLELTPGPTGLTYISHKAARRQPKVGTDQATNVPVLVSSVSMFILLMQ